MTNPHEIYCCENAIYYTAIRGARPATRIRREFLQLHQVEAWALNMFKGDGRTMIYAVSNQGSAHIKNV